MDASWQNSLSICPGLHRPLFDAVQIKPCGHLCSYEYIKQCFKESIGCPTDKQLVGGYCNDHKTQLFVAKRIYQESLLNETPKQEELPVEAIALLEKGKKSYRQGLYRKAVRIFARVLWCHPQSIQAKKCLGLSLQAEDPFDEQFFLQERTTPSFLINQAISSYEKTDRTFQEREQVARRLGIAAESMVMQSIRSKDGGVIQILQRMDDVSYCHLPLIDLSGCSCLTDQWLEVILKNCKELANLNLSLCTQITDRTIVAIVENAIKLSSLNLSGCPFITDGGLSLFSPIQHRFKVESFIESSSICRNLSQLDVRDCPNISEEALRALLKSNEKITDLQTSLSSTISEAKVKEFLGQVKLRDQMHPSAMRNKFTISSIVWQMTFWVQSLSFRECANLITDRVIYLIVANSPNSIRSIDLSFCSKVTDLGLQVIASFCTHLERLNLSFCLWKVTIDPFGISDYGVLTIAQSCPNLIELNLTGHFLSIEPAIQAEIVSDKDSALGPQSIFRKNLSQTGTPGYLSCIDYVLRVIEKYCHQLVRLHLADLPASHYPLLLEIAHSCVQLKYLEIPLLTDIEITKEWVDTLDRFGKYSESESKRVLQLLLPNASSFRFSSSCSEELVLFVVSCFPNIIALNLSQCSEISDSGLDVISQSCQQLTKLDLSGCINVTNEAVFSIALKLRGLQELNMPKNQVSFKESIPLFCQFLKTVERDQWTRFLHLFVYPQFPQIDKEAHFPREQDIEIIDHLSRICAKEELSHIFSHVIGIKNPLNFRDCSLVITDDILQLIFQYISPSSLFLINCSRITDEGLRFIIESCPNLIELDLSGCMNITPKGAVFFIQHCGSILKVKLPEEESFNRQCAQIIAHLFANGQEEKILGKLVDLVLVPQRTNICNQAVSSYDIDVLLGIKDCTKEGIKKAIGILFPGISEWQWWIFHCPDRVTDEVICILLNHCPPLQSLNLSNCSKITFSSLYEAIEGHHRDSLIRLALKGSTQFTALELLRLVECCLLLKDLTWRDDPAITLIKCTGSSPVYPMEHGLFERFADLLAPWIRSGTNQNCVDGVVAFVCSLFEIIYPWRVQSIFDFIPPVPGSEKIKDKIASHLIDSAIEVKKVTFGEPEINVSFRSREHIITDDLTHMLFRHFQNLSIESIDLSMCLQISDKSLYSIASYCKNLTTLNLKGCLKISGLGILSAMRFFKSLTSLTLPTGNRIDRKKQPINQWEASVRQAIKEIYRDVEIPNLSQEYDQAVLDYLAFMHGTNRNLLILESSIALVNEDDRVLKVLAKYCTNLTSLTLSSCDEITDNGLKAVAEHCIHLVRLNLNDCMGITYQGVTTIILECKKLKELTLPEHLTLFKGSVLTRSFGKKAIQAMHAICKNCNEGELKIIIPFLEGVDWKHWHFRVSSSSAQAVTDSIFEVLYEKMCLPVFTSLDLSYCSQITDQTLGNIIPCTFLKNLKLIGCSQLTLQGLVPLLRECKNLEELKPPEHLLLKAKNSSWNMQSLCELWKCDSIEQPLADYEWGKIIKFLIKGSQSDPMSFEGYTDSVTDKTIQLLVQYFPDIPSVIDLSYCQHVTYQGIAILVRGCKNLVELKAPDHLKFKGYLFDVTPSKIQALRDLCSACTSSLERNKAIRLLGGLNGSYLSFSDNNSVTDDVVQLFVEHCSDLSSIDLYHCSRITDEALQAIIHHCPSLKILDLRRCCSGITIKGIIALLKSTLQLEALKLGFSFPNLQGIKIIANLFKTCTDTVLLNKVMHYLILPCRKGSNWKLQDFDMQIVLELANICDEDELSNALGFFIPTKELSFRDCPNVSHRVVEVIFTQRRDFKSLDLSGMGLNQGQILHYLRKCRYLEKLTLGEVLEVKEIEAFVRSCPSLIELECDFPKKRITSDEIEDLFLLAETCEDSVIEKIINFRVQGTLSFYEPKDVDDRKVQIFAKYCKNLEFLDLSGSKVTYHGLKLFDFTYLKSLDLSKCKVTNQQFLGMIYYFRGSFRVTLPAYPRLIVPENGELLISALSRHYIL